MGNRDVYFVTSFNGRNELPVRERSQVDSKVDSNSKFLDTNTRPSNDIIEKNNAQSIHRNVGQEIDTVETTTVYQKKLGKFGKNKSINKSFSNFLLISSTILMITINL